MQRIAPLAAPLLLCVALAGCSAGGGSAAASPSAASSAAGSPAAASPASVAAGSSTTPPAATVPDTASPPATSPPAAPSSAAPAPGGGSVITFSGKVSGKMTATRCEGGIAQLEVDIDGRSTSYAGLIDAKDFTFLGPNSTAYTLDHGTALPRVSAGGTRFTVHATRLIGILNDDTVTATGSVTCP